MNSEMVNEQRSGQGSTTGRATVTPAPTRMNTRLTNRRMTGVYEPPEALGALNEHDKFFEAMQEDPEDCWNTLQSTLEELYATHESELAALRSELNEKNRMLANKEEAMILLMEERDQLSQGLMNVTANMHMSRASTEPDGARRSVKLPDPPVLTDGKEPKFEDWAIRMRSKLTANADHFTNEPLRRAYVLSRVEGDAALHLRPRCHPDAIDRLDTADDILQYLESLYVDPNHRQKAMNEFRRLKFSLKEDFHQFLSKFLRLAAEAKVSDDRHVDELYDKLPSQMKVATAVDRRRDPSFKVFSENCSVIAMSLQDSYQTASRSTTSQTATNGTNARATAPAHQRTSSTTYVERANMMKEGRCFHCKEKGHMRTDCPQLKKDGVLKSIEEDNRIEDSGKVQP